ncbi:MAG: beta strand repeat-containing protein, partial [Isosphaerales bacterium]
MITPLRPTKHAGPARHRLPRRRRRRTSPTAFSGTLFRLRPRLEVMEDRTLLSTFLVSNTGDSGPGSLRQAILDSNNAVGAPNTIDFDISGTGVQMILPLSSLPAIANPVLIDGTSQPGYGGTPLIELSGSQAGTGDGLTITGAGVTVDGLDINDFPQGAGIHITGTSASGNWIYGTFLGTDPTGTQAVADNVGVEIDAGAANNLIGTNGDGVNDAAERNLLSGNLFVGVWINGQGTDGNAIAGNFIGTSVTGDVALDNGTSPVFNSDGPIGGGVVIEGGASGNRIGTDGSSVDDAGQRNVIAGSKNDGIDIAGAGTDGNVVAGNFIGTDLTGTRSLGITYGGVVLDDGASSNWIGVNPDGGAAVGDEGNVISGNGYDGVVIFSLTDGNGVQVGPGSDGNVVAGDKIGTDATGAVALANAVDGVEIDSSSGNTIGGTGAGSDIISGNGGSSGFKGTGGAGVELDSASDNLVVGDFIGADATGTKALGNAKEGVEIDAASFGTSTDNTIGGTSAIAGNLITDNGGPGVVVTGDASVGNQITADRIFGNTGQAIDLGNDGVTGNSTTPREGPNNLRNFPIMFTTVDGKTEGWLGGSLPEATFRIDVFASAGYGSGGSGEAQDYLGSLEVITDATGQVKFPVPFTAPVRLPVIVPFTAPVGLPVITATATDPQGNTSEVSSSLPGGFRAQSEVVRLAPGQTSLTLSPASGDAISLQDSGAGSSGLTWDLSLSVAAGTLTLSSTAGLDGSGDGTGSLFYTGTLSALNTAMDGMTYAPPPGFQGNTSVSVEAQSDGIALLAGQVIITTRSFVVTTTADGGPGSLQQAILDSNTATGGLNTIDFAIPGAGTRTIVLMSPPPVITSSVLIDGFSQWGYAGTPLIALSGQSVGSSATLVVSAGDVSIRGLAIDRVAIDATTSDLLIGYVHAQGLTTQLSLLDSHGQVLIRSDGLAPGNADDAIDQHLLAGTYTLQVERTGGNGSFTLTTTLTPASAPFQPISVGSGPDAIVAGDFNGDGKLDLAVANKYSNDISVLLGNGDGTFQPQVTYAVGSYPVAIMAGDFNGDGKLDLAVANEGSFFLNSMGDTVSVLLGNGDGTFQPQVTYAVGSGPDAIVAGDFNGDGKLDLAVANAGSYSVDDGTVSVLLGNGDGTFQPQVTYAVGLSPSSIVAGDFTGDGRIDLAVAGGNYNSVTGSVGEVSVLLGNGDGTFQPAVQYAVGANPTGIVAGDFNGDGKLDLAVANEYDPDISVLLGNGDGTFRPQVTYALAQLPVAIVAGDFNGDGKLDLAVTGGGSASVLLGNGDGTFQSPVNSTVGYTPSTIVAGDFSGDGKLDLAAPNAGASDVSVLLGHGDGTFQS